MLSCTYSKPSVMKFTSYALPLTLALGCLWLAVISCSEATSRFQSASAGAVHARGSFSSTDCKSIHSACRTCKVSEIGSPNLDRQGTAIAPKSGSGSLTCTSCEAGWRVGVTPEPSCVPLRIAPAGKVAVPPGWQIDPATKALAPCNKGYYGPGATAKDPNGSCQKCPDGYTTLDNAATSRKDCKECLPGYGGGRCARCPYGTYSYGGSRAECEPCQPRTTSAQGAGSSEECVTTFPLRQASTAVWIPISDKKLLKDLGPRGAESEAACESLCGSTTNCILYQYRYVEPQQCLGLLQSSNSGDGKVAVGVKGYSGGTVADYAFYYLPANLVLGEQIRDVGDGKSLKQCMDACTALDECVMVRVVGAAGVYSCRLFSGVLDAEYSSGYQVLAQNLLQNGISVATTQ